MYSFLIHGPTNWTIDSQEPVLTSGFSYDRMGFMDATIVTWFDVETERDVLYMF